MQAFWKQKLVLSLVEGFAVWVGILCLLLPLWADSGHSQQAVMPVQGVLIRLENGSVVEPLNRLEGAGIKTVLLELKEIPNSEAWQKTIQLLESKGFLYWIAFSPTEARRSAGGWSILPERYRLVPDPDGVYDLKFPEADRALFIVADRSNASIKRLMNLEVRDHRAALAIGGNPETEVFLFYPHGRTSLPDLWEGWDVFRDAFFQLLTSGAPGAGFQGWVNLIPTVPDEDSCAALPDSPLFRLEWEAFLKAKYTDVAELERAWQTESSLESFAQAAKAIPLWRLKRGVPCLWLPEGKAMRLDQARSTFWDDYIAYLNSRLEAISTTCQSALKAAGSTKPTYTVWLTPSPENQPLRPLKRLSQPRQDGLAVWLTPESRSSWTHPLLQAVSRQESGAVPVSLMVIAPLNPEQPEAATLLLARLRTLGYPIILWQLPLEDPRASDWLRELLRSDQAIETPKLLPFPENVWGPAELKRLPDGHWWVPVAAERGEPLRWGSQIHGYWISLPTQEGSRLRLCLWSPGGTRTITMRSADDVPLTAFSTDGTPVQLQVKGERITVKVGEAPLVIDGFKSVPICETAVQEWLARFEKLEGLAKQRKRNFDIPRFTFQQAYSTWKRNPYPSFDLLRSSFEEAQRSMRPYAWFEAENAREHAFSTVRENRQASGQATLWLSTPLPPSGQGYFARYSFSVGEEGDYTLWLSAAYQSSPVEWTITRAEEADPSTVAQGRVPDTHEAGFTTEGGYGDAFVWIKLGASHLKPGEYVLTLRPGKPASNWYRAEWDVVLIAPPEIKPSDREPPDFE